MFHDATGNGTFLDCVFPEETAADKQTAIISSLSVVGTGSRQWHRSVQQSVSGWHFTQFAIFVLCGYQMAGVQGRDNCI